MRPRLRPPVALPFLAWLAVGVTTVATGAASVAPAQPPQPLPARRGPDVDLVRKTPEPRRAAAADLARWQRRAAKVTITRDDWGIAHVKGPTDADAIFGMMYAQAEDDFNRVETNYLQALGRVAEAEGEGAIWRDLRQKLFADPDTLRAQYRASPAWLRALMDAWADGLNYWLHVHPEVQPRVITRFEPWMPLAFSEGSIGGDVERIDLRALEAFYGKQGAAAGATSSGGSAEAPNGADEESLDPEPRGSNGIAIAPKNTVNGRALLLINPHTSFFFRSEQQVTSDEGLNAYGAATWGQFFLYQGFNARLGWMHTTATADVVDEFAETIVPRGDRTFYRVGAAERPVTTRRITVPYRTADGMASRTYTVYRTHHGPIVREADGKWIAVALMQKPVEALSQSFLRTKARDYASFRRALEFRANSSNSTIYADADGVIAYFHPQFVPKRRDTVDRERPVDGSDPANDWQGVHGIEESPFLKDPATGWIQNTNNWPYSAAGSASPKREAYPRYMDVTGENPRGVHAVRLLENRRDFTLPGLIDAAYDPWMPAFADMIPPLVAAWDRAAPSDTLRARLAEPIAALRAWDHRWGEQSVPTTVAIYWAEELTQRGRQAAARAGMGADRWAVSGASDAERLAALAAATERLTRDFGTWRTPWGEVNRFQRLTAAIAPRFDDAAPSVPVGFTSARWGSLASFGTVQPRGLRRRYGTSGNSFVAVVEFGKDSVRARAVSAGGESGHPTSPHFADQAERYATGALREVYFYPSQLARHTQRTYRPGER